MAKLTLTDITSGYASTTATNANNALIEAALENTLSRDGTSPNTMSANIDLNSNDLLNVGTVYATSVSVGGVDLATQVAAAAASAVAADASADAALVSELAAAASEAIVVASADNLADLEYMGNWATATAYLKNNIVYYNTDGSSYICLISHTSSAGFATDLGLGRWGLLAIQGAAGAGTGDMLKSENLSGLANYTTARSNMGLTIGTHIQAYDAQLATLAGITAQQATDLSATSTFIGTVLDDADAETARGTLGVTALLDLKSPLASPTFTGVPAAPTAATTTSTTQLATTAFVQQEITANVGGMALLGTLTTTSLSTQTLSGLTLTDYKALYISIDRVSSSGASDVIRFNSGSGPIICDGLTASTYTWYGYIWLNLEQNGAFAASSGQLSSVSTASSQGIVYAGESGITTASTAVVFASTSTFDSGTIKIYGVK